MIIGPVITKEELQQYQRYADKETVTLSDISAYTLEQQSVNTTGAQLELDKMKAEYGNGISALIRIYNACGEALSLVRTHDWHGHIWKHPVDRIIQNGQWSVFLHVHREWTPTGASGAVVYRAAQTNQDIFLGWQSPYIGDNSVYVESRKTNHWPEDKDAKVWAYMYDKKIDKDAGSNSLDEWGKLTVSGEVGQNSSPVVDFVIRHR